MPSSTTPNIPGLQLFSANRVETLAEALALSLSSSPLGNPFAPEIIAVPSPAMGRWLNLQLAQQHGITANIEYPLPAKGVWDLAHAVLGDLPKIDPLHQHALAWRIFEYLPELLDNPAFGDLQGYLSNPQDDLKRWQLAVRISDVFDRYQFYRPQLIRTWGQAHNDHWQAILWRKLSAEYPNSHRVAVIDRLFQRLQHPTAAIYLPERIHLFAISSLPPLYVEVLHALAQYTQIRLFLHSPTDQYWADLQSRKKIARLRVQQPEQANYREIGHELLASWGLQGQVFQDLLISSEHLQSMQWEDYCPPTTTTLLGQLQGDIFALESAPQARSADTSLQLHICHSALRECQVLHDQLLTLLQKNSQLSPEDILVMVPEINRYTPYIEAVFRKDEDATRPFIPWNLSDLSALEEHPLIRIFFQLLALPSSRFTASEVRSYLAVPELAQHFDLDENACEEVYQLLDLAAVRWGMDSAHKTALGLPATQENTWQQAEQRLFSGYALGQAENWQGIAPIIEAEGSKAVSLGRFWKLFERLQHYQQALAHTYSGEQWQILLVALLGDFFTAQEDEDGRLQQIRDALAEISVYAAQAPLSPRLIQFYLSQALSQQTPHNRYFSGGITFCGMRPMRSLPFQVICLLGMNDQAFPRRERPAEFDRMSQTWQPGDPSKSAEDRYLMLETLLCVRHTLYISYTGRDMKNNSERQPSVLVRELLTLLDSYPSPAKDDPAQPISERITTLHPLQAFSPRNYQDAAPSYDRYWHKLAEAIRQTAAAPEASQWPTLMLATPTTEPQDIDLGQLIRFVKHPVKYFYNTRLSIWLQQQASTEDEEAFQLDPLTNWSLKNRMARDLLHGKATQKEDLQARGQLPHGILSQLSFEQVAAEVTPLLEQLKAYRNTPPQSKIIALTLANGQRLQGQIHAFFPGKGLLHFTPSKLKGKTLLPLWLEHLALCATQQLQPEEHSTLLASDHCKQFSPLPAAQASAELAKYIAHYQAGLLYPLPVFPLASYQYALHGGGDAGQKKALASWYSNPYQNIPGDEDDPYIQLALRGVSAQPLADPEFARFATAFFQSALLQGEK